MTDVANKLDSDGTMSASGTPPPVPDAVSWMRQLSNHYRSLRERYPNDELVVVFDIDGTIIDTRHLVRSVLLDYDREHGTEHFRELQVDDIDVHEAAPGRLLDRFGLADWERAMIDEYYRAQMWNDDTTLLAHHPYRGVMEVVRWFQLQSNTVIALNTGRPETLRDATLKVLSVLGDEHRVSFSDSLLLMNNRPQGEGVPDGKVEALRELERRGMRIVAVIDNEPENLEVMSKADLTEEILFLHASTIFLSSVRPVPRTVVGTAYDLGGLISPVDVPHHVQLVCDDVSTRQRLGLAVTEHVTWLSAPIRLDPYGRIELAAPEGTPRDDVVTLDRFLDVALRADRRVRLDVQSPNMVLPIIDALVNGDIADEQLWFSGPLELLGEDGVATLRRMFPQATISCPADFIAPLVFAALDQAIETMDLLRDWGIDRLSIRWDQPRVRQLLAELEAWGREVDITGLSDRTETLEAAILLPRSVTSAGLI